MVTIERDDTMRVYLSPQRHENTPAVCPLLVSGPTNICMNAWRECFFSCHYKADSHTYISPVRPLIMRLEIQRTKVNL